MMYFSNCVALNAYMGFCICSVVRCLVRNIEWRRKRNYIVVQSQLSSYIYVWLQFRIEVHRVFRSIIGGVI